MLSYSAFLNIFYFVSDIKELACDDVHLLAKALPKEFHFSAEKLLNPLARAMTHQQKKVRVASIKAVGCVIQNSGFDQFQLIGKILTQSVDIAEFFCHSDFT